MAATQRLIDASTFDNFDYSLFDGTLTEDAVQGMETVLTVINSTPTVDAVPVVHGHWVKATGAMPPEYFGKHVCSVCDSFAPNRFNSMFEWLSKVCPSCGAKMD